MSSPMATSNSTNCPSCRAAMEARPLSSVNGGTVDLDVCYPCQGIWFDPQENLKLAPAAVAELFRLLHEHRDDARQPLALQIHCPRCSSSLTRGFDVVRSGRYVTYRCATRKPGAARCSRPRSGPKWICGHWVCPWSGRCWTDTTQRATWYPVADRSPTGTTPRLQSLMRLKSAPDWATLFSW